jgi:hypothetical protein
MPFRRTLCLVVLLGVCFANNANAATRLEDFFGVYLGFGMATDRSGPIFRTERDLSLAIGPLAGGGFEIVWSTVKQKGSNPGSLVSEESEHTAQFRPSGKPGVFLGVNSGTLFGEAPITWARLQGDVLVVYSLGVDESGVAELHVYQRMLTDKGLELFFIATQDNIEIRSVRGRYRKQ